MRAHSASHTYDQTAHVHKRVIGKISLLASAPCTSLKTHTQRCTRSQVYIHTHHPTCVTSNNAAEPMIFPRGPLHVIGHAQLIPCVDPEHNALSISRLAECVCWESASLVMRRRATGGTVALAAQRQRALWRAKVK